MKNLSRFLLILAYLSFFVSCKKDPNQGKIKYEITSTTPAGFNIQYTNASLNSNTLTENGSKWSQTIDNVTQSGDNFYFYVTAYNQSVFSVTARIYYEGEIVDEQVITATGSWPNPSGTGTRFEAHPSLHFQIPQ